ncbi:hypothetical protein [Novosphingobium sp. fls2-241-R2A-195]|uniref:hypothetical protein n=1 Tax=Novosphingobium sp. fls2-241-R2A-195 TaxID=3040296 RepID=UPI00254D797A|nr:hypothetical protein [Novosphingobium sp. fls2-241-R2A-195]
MTGRAIVRGETTIEAGGVIHHDDQPLSWEEADTRAGRRLDRRRNWAFLEGKLCVTVSWTQPCSGCSEGYGRRGFGCDECGYHGKVRNACWVPASILEIEV